jgi:hypothetical protein
MAWWDDFQRQQEQHRRILEQYRVLVDIPSSPLLKFQRTLQEQHNRYGRLIRDMGIGHNLAGISPVASAAADRIKSLSFPSALQESLASLIGKQAAELAVSPAYLESFKTLSARISEYSSLTRDVRAPAWLRAGSGIEDLMATTLAEFRSVVPQEAIDAARSRFPAPPQEADDVALENWLSAVVDWFHYATRLLPPTRTVIALLRHLAFGILSSVLAVPVVNHLERGKTRERDQLEARRHAEIESKFAQLAQQLNEFAAREQIMARVVREAPVHLEANSKAKRVGRLRARSSVKVLSRRGRWFQIEYGDGDVGWVFAKT